MEINKIREYWERLQNKELNHQPLYPLTHLEALLQFFNLPSLSDTNIKVETPFESVSVDPGFANCSNEILLWLRVQLYAEKELPTVSTWAEKLMRFCELRLSTLRKRSLDKCKTLSSARLLMLHLTAFLLDYAVYSKDARYLNTALKLTDLKWLLDEKSIFKDLVRSNQADRISLFQVRILLFNEYALERLRKGNTL